MSKIEIRKIGITELDTDAIVNAANEGLWAGSGVCGAIFDAAGYKELQVACNQIGHCETGSAVITPGFNLMAKHIIHAVGPRWMGGVHDEPKLLYGAYRKSLELAVENGCKSIGFPLISAGIFGYPVDRAWRKALQACSDFIEKGNEIDIVFAVLEDRILEAGRKTLQDVAPQLAAVEKDVLNPSGLPAQRNTHRDKLKIADREVDAVFFHKPEEPHGFLSNWYPSPFDLDGIHFTSAEQYIMFRKCVIFGDRASADAVLATDDPAEQQAIAQNAKGYLDKVWAGMRQTVAMHGLLAKFTQNQDLKQKLLDTGDAYLVECAHQDIIWTCGSRLHEKERFDTSLWRGQNILGFALMEVRSVLRREEK